MQCVEFKSELRDPDAARAGCQRAYGPMISTGCWTETYFKLHDGRLKRRECEGEQPQWIFYHRLDRIRPRLCTFSILSDAQAQTRWGTAGLKPWVTIRKQRSMWMVDQVRVHIDHIEGLGWFLELETLVGRRHPVIEAHEAITMLREVFSPVLGEAISASYADLVAQQQALASGSE